MTKPTKKTQNPEPPNADNEYACLKITSSQVFPLSEPTGKTVAFARCTLNEQFQVTGLRIVNGVNGLFVSYPNDPSYKGDDFRAIFYPITRELRNHIEEVLLAQYTEISTNAWASPSKPSSPPSPCYKIPTIQVYLL
jgi:stage V sporulation protein G